MKKRFALATSLIVLLAPFALLGDDPEPMAERLQVINFQGALEDDAGLPYDGTVAIEARFHNAPAGLPENLVYAEEFAAVDVDRGIFSVLLLGGTQIEGTAPSPELFAAQSELYVDIKVNGSKLLEAWPVGAGLAVLRAERAAAAEMLRQPVSLAASDIPAHSTGLISTGTLGAARLPPIPGARIADDPSTPQNDVFAASMIPVFSAGKVTSGSFAKSAFASGISAEWFMTEKLGDTLLPADVMRSGDLGIRMGTASHGQAVQIPAGFGRAQCTWLVSVRSFNEDVGAGEGIDHLQVTADPNGVVNCVFDTNTGEGPADRECSVNYLTLCKK